VHTHEQYRVKKVKRASKYEKKKKKPSTIKKIHSVKQYYYLPMILVKVKITKGVC